MKKKNAKLRKSVVSLLKSVLGRNFSLEVLTGEIPCEYRRSLMIAMHCKYPRCPIGADYMNLRTVDVAVETLDAGRRAISHIMDEITNKAHQLATVSGCVEKEYVVYASDLFGYFKPKETASPEERNFDQKIYDYKWLQMRCWLVGKYQYTPDPRALENARSVFQLKEVFLEKA